MRYICRNTEDGTCHHTNTFSTGVKNRDCKYLFYMATGAVYAHTQSNTYTILSQHRSFPLYFSIPSVLPSPTMVVSWGTVWQKQPKFLSNTVHIPNELHPSSHTAPTICKQRGLQPLWAFYGKSWRSYCLQHLENTIMLLKIQSFLSYSLGFWCRFLHLGMHKCWYA